MMSRRRRSSAPGPADAARRPRSLRGAPTLRRRRAGMLPRGGRDPVADARRQRGHRLRRPARRGFRAVLCSRVTKPTLCPAISEPPSISPSITARRSAPAQKCSISSCASFCDSSPRANRSMTSRCTARNRSVAGLASARTGITGKRGSSCDRSDRVARRGADEGLLEARMGDRFAGADKAGAELHAGGAHFEIGQHRLAAADAAGDEHRHLAEMRQDLLRQHRRSRPGRYARPPRCPR